MAFSNPHRRVLAPDHRAGTRLPYAQNSFCPNMCGSRANSTLGTRMRRVRAAPVVQKGTARTPPAEPEGGHRLESYLRRETPRATAAASFLLMLRTQNGPS